MRYGIGDGWGLGNLYGGLLEDRSAEAYFGELQLPESPRRGEVYFAELRLNLEARAGEVFFAEFSAADPTRAAEVFFAELSAEAAPIEGFGVLVGRKLKGTIPGD